MTYIHGKWVWWQVVDGVAVAIPDSVELSEAISRGEHKNMFSTIEGAILHGGVQASAFERTVDELYDSKYFCADRKMVRVGLCTTTKITASSDGLKLTYRSTVLDDDGKQRVEYAHSA